MGGVSSELHVIRLRGRWQLETTDSPGNTIRLPARWSFFEQLDRNVVRIHRVFHRPTGLGPATSVLLAVSPWPCPLRVSLSGLPLGALGPGQETGRWEIARLLGPRNRVTIDVNLGEPTATLDEHTEVGQVWLEIDPRTAEQTR